MRYIIIISVIFASCQSKCEIEKDIDALRYECGQLQLQKSNLQILKDKDYAEIATLDETLKEKRIYASGSIPHYMINLHFSPTTFRLRNSMINSFNIEIPVDKRFYDSHAIQDQIGRMYITRMWITK